MTTPDNRTIYVDPVTGSVELSLPVAQDLCKRLDLVIYQLRCGERAQEKARAA